MPRYIDADALKRRIYASPMFFHFGEDGFFIRDAVLNLIEKFPPTANVVPKSEYERLTIELEAMRTAANSYKMHYERLAKEIFEEIEATISSMKFNAKTKRKTVRVEELIEQMELLQKCILEIIAEIKKNYMEEEKE